MSDRTSQRRKNYKGQEDIDYRPKLTEEYKHSALQTGSSAQKEMSGSGPSRKGGLTKNSTIKCIIDDLQLQQGLLVVSFTHKDNRFQGVLLQLNRERGIPCGISFPKDCPSGEKKEVDQGPNPSLVPPPPLNQRHTYFQDLENGPKFRSLRRIIKTPARFKNSRMSLRPVLRPVLCAKCGVLCEDNVPPETTTTTTIPKSNGNNEKPKKNGGVGVTGKKASSKLVKIVKEELENPVLTVPKASATCLKIQPVVENPLDYNYEGVGSHGIIDNVWKRPLAKPLRYQKRNTNSKIEDVKEKLVKISTKISSTNPNNKLTEKVNSDIGKPQDSLKSRIPECPVFRIKRPPMKSTDSTKQKANNLKLCISKLTLARENKFLDNSNISEENVSKLDANPQSQQSQVPCHSSKQSEKYQPTSETENRLSVPPMKIPIWKNKIKLKRRNSAMPYRFRESGKTGHSASGWRMRRISTMSNPQENTISNVNEPFDELQPNSETLSVQIENQNQVEKKCQHDHYQMPIIKPFSENFRAPNVSGCNFDIDTNIEQLPNPEPAKIPVVIKISFGSSGNGIVVQIPPKSNQIEDSQVAESEYKATRKAMKKAKKEARKKQMTPINPTESSAVSPSSALAAFASTPLTLYPDIRLETSPVRESSFATDITTTESEGFFSSSSNSIQEQILTEFLEFQSHRGGKKRKKDKKRKKEKDHKENDLERASSGESQTITATGPELSSPELKSDIPLIPHSPRAKGSVSPKPKEANLDQEGASNSTEAHQRVCISLKRLNTNAYIPWHPKSPNFSNDELGTNSDSAENEEVHDFQDASFLNDESSQGVPAPVEAVESYNHIQSNQKYKKGDIIWGKSTGCPWWPGKIVEILLRGMDEARAKVAWYKSASQSFVAFTNLHPFEEYFNTKYTKNRRRGSYQQAVREALTDAHLLNSQDLSND